MAKSESSVLGLVGCGAQAVTQLHAISRVAHIDQVLYFDTDPEALLSFPKRCEMLGLSAHFSNVSVAEIVKSSDILSTATSIAIKEGPLFDHLDYNPHLHINAVGSDFPGKVELPIDLLENAFVCPDFKEQAVIAVSYTHLTLPTIYSV